MSAFSAVLFDVDGTLQDTTEYIFQAFEHVCTMKGSPLENRAVLIPLMGHTLKDMYQVLLPDYHIDELRELHNDFQSKRLDLVQNFDGVGNLLRTLHSSGIKLAAVSSRKRELVEETLKHGGLLDYFSIVVGPYDTPHAKPHPAPALHALKHLELAPHDAYFVGDSHVDVLTGKNAGTKTIRVTYGFNTEHLQNPSPDHIAESVEILSKILRTPVR